MDWRDHCVSALAAAGLFEDSWHRTRFKELIDCYGNYPFFTKGLCKCIYLSAWDEEHFCVMLETLTDLSLGKESDTREMRIKGDALAEEESLPDSYVYHLSNAFLDNASYSLADAGGADEQVLYIIRRALEAAEIIDEIFDN